MFYFINNISYNYSEGVLTKKEQEIKLTNKQKKLLNYFIDNPNKILSKQTIMEEVWGRIITENSVDQFISTLRGYLEDNPSSPQLLITHFGKGISLDARVELKKQIKQEQQQLKISGSSVSVVTLLVIIILAGLYFFQNSDEKPEANLLSEVDLGKGNKVLVLPTAFEGEQISLIEQKGIHEVLKSIFTRTASEGQVLFDETSQTTNQSIEKHWRLEKSLLVIQTKIIKDGGIYKSTIELSNGVRTIQKKQLSSANLNDLLNEQINYIASISKADNKASAIAQSPSQLYIEALGYKQKGDLEKAKSLIEKILLKKGDYFQARLTLAELLFSLKKYDESLAQLETLKSTSAYKIIGAEIELTRAKIHHIKHDYQKIIADLTNYQLNNLEINEIKKAKIKLMMGDAYYGLSDFKNSMHNYLSSVENINENLNPLLYSKSYFGQAISLQTSSIGKRTFALFEKAYEYARISGNINLQVKPLNEMANILFSQYKWEEAVTIQKQALALMELDNNQFETAKGLGTLAGILNQRGHFTEAKEINDRLGRKAKELNADILQLQYLRYDAIIALNTFNWEHAQRQSDAQLALAIKTNNLGMKLDNAFIEFELRLIKKDTKDFLQKWDESKELITKNGLERYQIYLDLYLARYYKAINKDKKAIALIQSITEKALVSNDYKIIVDAHNNLAEIYFKTDPKQSLSILNNIEQYNPHPNPYLDLKAKALHLLGNDVEALSILNQAKKVYNESWTVEIQTLYEEIQQSIK